MASSSSCSCGTICIDAAAEVGLEGLDIELGGIRAEVNLALGVAERSVVESRRCRLQQPGPRPHSQMNCANHHVVQIPLEEVEALDQKSPPCNHCGGGRCMLRRLHVH